jgi:hypothetical protein
LPTTHEKNKNQVPIRKLKQSWLLFYLVMSWTGAGLAPIVYMLIRVGIVSPSGAASGGTGLANLNLIAIYAFAALTGLCSKTAMEKLGELFSTLFRTHGAPSKDALGSEKLPEDPSPAERKPSRTSILPEILGWRQRIHLF